MATGKSLKIRRMASPHAQANESAVCLPGSTASEILEKWPGLAFDYGIYVQYKHFTLLGTLIIFTKKCDRFIAVLKLFDFFIDFFKPCQPNIGHLLLFPLVWLPTFEQYGSTGSLVPSGGRGTLTDEKDEHIKHRSWQMPLEIISSSLCLCQMTRQRAK